MTKRRPGPGHVASVVPSSHHSQRMLIWARGQQGTPLGAKPETPPRPNPNQLSLRCQARLHPPLSESLAAATGRPPIQIALHFTWAPCGQVSGGPLAVQSPRLFSVSAPRAAPAFPLALSLSSPVPGALGKLTTNPCNPLRRERGTRLPWKGTHARRNAQPSTRPSLPIEEESTPPPSPHFSPAAPLFPPNNISRSAPNAVHKPTPLPSPASPRRSPPLRRRRHSL